MNFVRPVAVASRRISHTWSAQRAFATQLLAFSVLFLVVIAAPQRSAAQIQVDTSNPVNPAADHCSLQEAIYATEFGSNVAVDQTDPDDTYNTGCSDSSGAWNTIDLPGGTLTFNNFWDGDAHNPFGATATPIIFKAITIRGHGTILQPGAGAGNFRLFAIGQASISPTSGVLKTGTYSGTGNLTLQDVEVSGFKMKGGDGACGGGGGLGAGGAIYIGKVSSGTPALTIENSTFQNNSITGGHGSAYNDTSTTGNCQRLGGGGGGGLGGNGGGTLGTGDSGGAGGGGARGNGGNSQAGGGGGGGTVYDGGQGSIVLQGGDPHGVGGSGGYLCGGTGSGDADGYDATCPGGGGGGGGFLDGLFPSGNGGKGSYGGGGGGGTNVYLAPGDGGDAGFGGGGGGGGISDTSGEGAAGNGGFGGGSGVSPGHTAHSGPFAGSASDPFAGGGAGLGGAIFNDSGIIVVRNSTFVGNSSTGGGLLDASKYPLAPSSVNGLDAGGAIFSRNGSLSIENATISGNTTSATATGGGIVAMSDGATASLKLDNTILANNGTQECYVVNSVALNGAGNLIMANDPAHGCPGVAQTTDPQLAALALNAPGDTRTMAIQYGSSAVDNGDDSALATDNITTDQRGAPRPQGPHTDIGAYEAPPPSADLSITKAVSTSTAQPGDTVTYTLSVSNAGPNTANTVTVSDTLPTSYVTFVSCTESTGTGTCTYNGTTVTVTYASLAANASSTVTINTTVNSAVTDGVSVGNNASVSESDPTDPNTANNTSANAYFTIHNKADLAVTKSVSSTSPYWPQGVEAGDALTYTVTLTNKGPYDARSVVLSDSAPAGVTFTGCTASVGTCVWSTSSASLSLSSFTNGSKATLTIQATLNFSATDGSLIINTTSATSPTNDPDPTNNSGSASFTALNNSDLFVTQSATKLASRQLKYTVNVKNLGKYIGKQLLLTDPIPSGSKFVSITPGAWACSAPSAGSTGTISCTLNTLAVNATQSMTFVVKVTTPGSVLVNNTASVSTATNDPNTANNTSALSTKVGP